jgi:hypothetical protein
MGMWTRGNRLAVAGIAAMAAVAYIGSYLTDPRRPTAPAFDRGWWQFSDQARYLRATLAWAAGNLNPSEHWYLPGYPLLAVPFVHLTHSNPFLLPDLVILLTSVVLVAVLAGKLAPHWRLARSAGAAAFLTSLLWPPDGVDAWVTPWTSTPQVVLTFGCLLAALRFADRPQSWRAMFVAGLCVGGVAACRPADTLVLALVAGAVTLYTLIRVRPGWGVTARTVVAGVAGVLIAVTPTVVAYVAVNGWQMNGYLTLSASIGFEWRLLPLRWVTIMLDPQPLFPEGHGLIEIFPWIVPGIAGMAACLVSPPGRGARLPHVVVVAAACAHVALYLCYRDLHPLGLWQFYNYHYFKWVLPVFAVYAVLLVYVLLERRWTGLAAGGLVLALLLPWRAELVPEAGPPMALQAGTTLHLPPLSLGVGDAIVVAANGSFDAVYSGQHHLYVGENEEKWYGSTADFKTSPLPGGLMILPLRPLRTGPVSVHFGPGITLATDIVPRLARAQAVFGMPCWLPAWVGAAAPACQAADLIPGPVIHPGETIAFDAGAARMLVSGWSIGEAAGRWTEGHQASFHFRLSPPDGRTLVVEANAFVPAGDPLHVSVLAGGTAVAAWDMTDGDLHSFRAPLPPGAIGPDDALQVTFRIANPRRPRDLYPSSTDTRRLGLFVHSVTIEP